MDNYDIALKLNIELNQCRHKDFVTIVSAYIEGSVQLLAVLTDRNKETVKTFLESIPKELKKTVK